MAEMDALLCPSHPDADPKTGAAHACGHHVQGAAILGVAAALKEPGALDDLSGRIRLCCVPAEEYIETDYRKSLKEKGIIRYFSGKQEFLYRGYFDGVDMAFILHAGGGLGAAVGAVGFVGLDVCYKGKAAHASNPWDGINALTAANCGLNALNAIRDNFREDDLIRVQTIITHGGDATNTIPDRVTLHSRIRGITDDAMDETVMRVTRALAGGALSLGAELEITSVPGYAPLVNDPGLLAASVEAAKRVGMEFYCNPARGTGSTDVGDLSAIMPAIHPFGMGYGGSFHAANSHVADLDAACVDGAAWELSLITVLLENGAAVAKQVLADFKPRYPSKEAYLAHVDAYDGTVQHIRYDGNTATVTLKGE